MAANTKIEWCHATFNPWRGCTKVSAGCANCYAETLSARNPKVLGEWGPKGSRAIASESYWRQPLKWDREAAAAGERRRVFCASRWDATAKTNIATQPQSCANPCTCTLDGAAAAKSAPAAMRSSSPTPHAAPRLNPTITAVSTIGSRFEYTTITLADARTRAPSASANKMATSPVVV